MRRERLLDFVPCEIRRRLSGRLVRERGPSKRVWFRTAVVRQLMPVPYAAGSLALRCCLHQRVREVNARKVLWVPRVVRAHGRKSTTPAMASGWRTWRDFAVASPVREKSSSKRRAVAVHREQRSDSARQRRVDLISKILLRNSRPSMRACPQDSASLHQPWPRGIRETFAKMNVPRCTELGLPEKLQRRCGGGAPGGRSITKHGASLWAAQSCRTWTKPIVDARGGDGRKRPQSSRICLLPSNFG